MPSLSAAVTTGWWRRRTWPGRERTVVLRAAARRRRRRGQEHPFGPGLQGHVAVVRGQPAPARSRARPAARASTGITSTRRGRTSRPTADGRYLQLPDDPAARHEPRSPSSPTRTPTPTSGWDALADGSAELLGPLLTAVPPKLGSQRPGRLLGPGGAAVRSCARCDVRCVVDLTRLFTVSIADLVERLLRVARDAGRALGLRRDRHLGRARGRRDRVRDAAPPRRRRGEAGRRVGVPAGRHGRRSPWRMADAARSFGAEIRTEAAVARIAVRDGGRDRASMLAGGEEIDADVVVTTAHPKIASCELLDRRRPARRTSSTTSSGWQTRAGTVKINVAVDRLPEFAAKPGATTRRCTAARSCWPRAWTRSRRRSKRRSPGGRRRGRSPTSASPACSTPRWRRAGQHVVSMFTQWVPHEVGGRASHGRARGVRGQRDRAGWRQVAPGFAELDRAPPGDRAARDAARVRPGRRQHLPR